MFVWLFVVVLTMLTFYTISIKNASVNYIKYKKGEKMPLLTTEMKKALRRLQADELMTKKDLAKYLGVSESTAKTLTKDKEPLNVKTKVFNAVISAISESYWAMNKLSQAIAQSKHAKPYYRKIILDLLVQLTTEGAYKSLKSYKSARVILTGEQKEMLKAYTDSVILLLGIGMAFHEIKQFLTTKKAETTTETA